MTILPPSKLSVVRKEEKEGKIRDFMAQDLSLAKSAGGIDSTHLILARSIESPVARALLALRSEAAQAGIACRMLLMLEDGLANGVDCTLGDYARQIDARIISDHRLLDAHELLVLSPQSVWIGDCMRRDPSKCDAYEYYSTAVAEASASAMRSFERLWRIGKPLRLQPAASEPVDVAVLPADLPPPAGTQSVEAATRH